MERPIILIVPSVRPVQLEGAGRFRGRRGRGPWVARAGRV